MTKETKIIQEASEDDAIEADSQFNISFENLNDAMDPKENVVIINKPHLRH